MIEQRKIPLPATSRNAMKYDETNPFARILRSELPCIKVAETDATLAFMDLMPQADGHVLVVPKEAAAEIFELSDAATVECIRMTQRIAIAVKEALKPDGVFIGQFNGAAAGQTVAHVHFHVIPRWDGVPLRLHAREMAPQATLEEFAQRIRAQLGSGSR
jgi:histidine triad (HIT) family protein